MRFKCVLHRGCGMPVMQSPPGAVTRIDGRDVLYFAGTAYLGLQGDPRVIDAACAAARTYGIHPATSRTGYGEAPLLLEVERLAAAHFGTDDALYLASGYAGMATLAQAAGEVALVVADDWLHIAGLDAGLLTRAPVVRFRHGDPDDLRAQLAAHAGRGRTLVMCDGVSPVRGDVAPIDAYLHVLEGFPTATLLVDDAHGVGVLGKMGRGSIEHVADHAGREIAVNVQVRGDAGRQVWMAGTLSKAMGGAGGILPGSRTFIDHLRANARWYHGAAASAAPVAGATAAALVICQAEPDRRSRLLQNARQLRSGLRDLGLQVEDWPTPIICLPIGDGDRMAGIQAGLLADGFAIAHVRNYAGIGADGALRIAVTALHTQVMLNQLIAAIARRL